MKFIHLIILAILCLTIPPILIYTTSYTIIESYSYVSEENVKISGVFSGNFSESKNNTIDGNISGKNAKLSGFFSGTVKDMNGLWGFAGSIDGNMGYFILNESNLFGEFSGRLNGRQIEIKSEVPFILILLLFFLVFYSLIYRPKEIARKIDRLFLIFSIGLGIDFGISFVFLKILDSIQFSAFSNYGFLWQPSASLIFSALIPWLVFLIAVPISIGHRLTNFHR